MYIKGFTNTNGSYDQYLQRLDISGFSWALIYSSNYLMCAERRWEKPGTSGIRSETPAPLYI